MNNNYELTTLERFNLEALVEARMERFHIQRYTDQVEAITDYIADIHWDNPLGCNIDNLLVNYLVILTSDEMDEENQELIESNLRDDVWKEVFTLKDSYGKYTQRWFINELDYFPIVEEV